MANNAAVSAMFPPDVIELLSPLKFDTTPVHPHQKPAYTRNCVHVDRRFGLPLYSDWTDSPSYTTTSLPQIFLFGTPSDAEFMVLRVLQ